MAGIATGRWFDCAGQAGHAVFRSKHVEQLACSRDVGSPAAVGEQAVVADAVEAAWQHVDEEAADELVRCECHHLVPVAALDAVVFPFEDVE